MATPANRQLAAKRISDTDAWRLEVKIELVRGGRLEEIAGRLKVSRRTLCRWIKELKEQNGA
jgi:transposase